MTAPTSFRPPTTPGGRVSDSDFSGLLDEYFADTPVDLVHPNSVHTYGAMRRDSAINAGLSGYALQLHRASWQLDGHGVDPAHTLVVSDDMDLPIVGVHTHTAARTRGVSWAEYLRVTLSATLGYGHMGFALGADMSSGLARLAVLAERPPQTITQIHGDPITGAFLGVTQDKARKDGAPQIAARDMVWHCRDREAGSNWAGVSLLRAAWLPWLIKREMIRVHATANRRWSSGVPVNEALPGTAPTDGQMQEAQRMASAARGGETAGASAPPGFRMRILGLDGQIPDTLSFLKWLDAQISKAMLMPHLELGQGSNGGSRALGEAFIDSWTLALESMGEQIASEATRQIAARIVEWNWGTDVPVPRVVVAGVGSRREVTATSLQQLLSSGALSADPALEAWIRREYRLPEREDMVKPAPSVAGGTLAAANRRRPDAPAVALRARRASRKGATAGQLALPLNAAAEDSSQDEWQAALDELREQWPDIAEPVVEDLTEQAVAAADAEDLGALGTLVVSAAVLAGVAAAIGAAMQPLSTSTALATAAVAVAAGVSVDLPDTPGAERVSTVAEATAGVIANGYSSAAARRALQVSGGSATADELAEQIRAVLDDMSSSESGWAVDNLGAALTAAQNAGRTAVFELAPPTSLLASERNDKARCDQCSEVDGRRYDSLADALKDYPVAGFKACEGGLRCRGELIGSWD
ncbi:MAG TPA: DUF935 family protein [Micromonosporaceae bacterium]|nr:DUF935 family protein [Micromonosporaceae bacterium]